MKRRNAFSFWTTVFLFSLASPALQGGPAPTAAELNESLRWASAKFLGQSAAPEPAPGLYVAANHDPVQLNARAGQPMRLGKNLYTRGLYCHATSKLIARLPAPGAQFTAVAGVDSNEQTSGGRGSVCFAVQAGGQERYRSAVVREGQEGLAINVALAGAREFTLVVEDGGDGIACDQADWAEAKVRLQDGRELWLADLGLVETTASPSPEPPFSFVYGGQSSAKLLASWPVTRVQRPIDAQRQEHVQTWVDAATGLQVRCVAVEYRDFPTVEWTVYFKNTGATNSPILAEVLALDTKWERGSQAEFELHHQKGTWVRADDFEPLTTVFKADQRMRFAPSGGRPCGQVWPYYNLAWGNAGAIIVVGWPGQWAAEFTRDSARSMHVTAGQERVRLRLAPGEEIRTPLMVVQFWRGDWLRAQNLWRRWMLAHNLPRVEGQLPKPLFTPCSSHQFAEMIKADEASQKLFIDRYLEEGLRPDYWWMDAGWYVNQSGWPNTGTWLVDSNRFPRGLRAITDHAHAKQVKSIVWFEPERVTPGTQLYEQHPAWLLGKGKGQKLLNLGHAAARQWLVNHVDGLIKEQGIDLYRQDYNVDPLSYWRETDAEERQGATENHYVTGYLAYWDELRRRNPAMLIDSCASGGHRNDLETLRRSLPFLRSDYILDPVGNQAHTYGLALWLPYHGTGTGANQLDLYELRSNLACPHGIGCWDVRDRTLPYDRLRQFLRDWRSYADNYFGDFYPLTRHTLAQDHWMAWQFDRPEADRGMVQAFRRAQSPYESARFRLQGLEAESRYQITDLDSGKPVVATGRELMERGLLVTAQQQPSAVVLVYTRVAKP